MKINHFILSLFAGALTISACSDLDYNEIVVRDETWTYEFPSNGVKNLVYDVYAQMFNEFEQNYNGALRASATDEAVFASALSTVHNFYNGAWSPANPFSDTWRISYRAIAEINTYLEKIKQVDLSEYQYDANYANMKLQYDLFPYELRFLRAYFYFELVKTYGDVPLVTKTLSNAEANNVTRTPADQVFQYIIDECNAVAEFLPINYKNEPYNEIGRATRPAALALRTRALLYQASPLFNTSNNKERWLLAAKSAKELLDRADGWDLKLANYKDLWGDNAFEANSELIMGVGTGPINTFERANYPVGVENGSSGNCPSQTLVDMYEYQIGTNAGKTFGEVHPGNINVTEESPYTDLDPRFALTVVKNGDTWPSNSAQASTIETYHGGFNGAPKVNATPTGYYLRKYVDGAVITTYNNSTQRRHTWIIWRLSEIYLDYAEAMYNYYGDADNPGETGMSANEAVNMLRNRADIQMPEFKGSDNWLSRYERERAIEFAFEDQRFWDVRRWKKGSQYFTKVQEAKLTREGDGTILLTRETVNRQWDEKFNLFPIPQSEIQKNGNLTQNPYW